MKIGLSFNVFQTTTTRAPGCAPTRQPDGLSQLLFRNQTLNCLEQLNSYWSAHLFRPEAPPLPSPVEMGKGHEQPVGPHTARVAQDGSMSISTAPPEMSLAGTQGGPLRSAFAAHLKGAEQPPVQIKDGKVKLPNGQERPFGRTGLLVKMADGRQFGVGRNRQDSPEHVRWVSAEKGQQIPASPPGQTTVLQLDEGGNVVSESVI